MYCKYLRIRLHGCWSLKCIVVDQLYWCIFLWKETLLDSDLGFQGKIIVFCSSKFQTFSGLGFIIVHQSLFIVIICDWSYLFVNVFVARRHILHLVKMVFEYNLFGSGRVLICLWFHRRVIYHAHTETHFLDKIVNRWNIIFLWSYLNLVLVLLIYWS